MKTEILPSLTILSKIADQLSHSFNAQTVRAKVLPVVSQVFKDNLLFSGPEMELIAIFLIDYKNTMVTTIQSAYRYAIHQFKPNPCGRNNRPFANSLQPCI